MQPAQCRSRHTAAQNGRGAAVSESGEMQPVPPDQEMPKGEMHEQEGQEEQDEMPSGAMEPGA